IKDVKKYREKLFYKYGTTLRGLTIEKGVDPEEYFGFVNNINIEDFLERDEELINVLMGIEQEKIIFTNSPREYALNVLTVLGVEKFFSYIIDIRYLDFIPKPSEEAFKKLFKGRIKPKESMIIDDYEHNLKPAKKFGMTTVLVGNGNNGTLPYVDYYINKITDIEKILRK
ncbi:MAG: HAD-IA family hydrolase, partial [Nanoarchaeota archaeon]|nr:HAD-IA family hydrolase [Nanoarchaeota archaeon]